MKIYTESERFILREVLVTDVDGFYELDSDPEVHRFLGNEPVADKQKLTDIILMIRQQYAENGIARWAIEDKITKEFMGWCGIKLERSNMNGHESYYDLGYRIIRKYWGQGIASETSLAVLKYGFQELNLPKIFAVTHPENLASQRVLVKLGFEYVEKFNWEGETHFWYRLERDRWPHKKSMFK